MIPLLKLPAKKIRTLPYSTQKTETKNNFENTARLISHFWKLTRRNCGTVGDAAAVAALANSVAETRQSGEGDKLAKRETKQT